ncbi:MAG: hypothetical protein IJ494_09615 [Bacteroides sp.]|nr:hypothetical protein [Bacteroides sp.]
MVNDTVFQKSQSISIPQPLRSSVGGPLRSLTLDRYARQHLTVDERSGLPIHSDALKGVKVQRRCNEKGIVMIHRHEQLF